MLNSEIVGVDTLFEASRFGCRKTIFDETKIVYNTCSCAISGMSREMMKMDGRDSAECQNWEKKDIEVIMEIDLNEEKDKIVNSCHLPLSKVGLVTSQATRARLEKKLGSGSARELNEPSLSLNLGLINLGLDSKKLGSGPRDPSVAGTRLPPKVSDRQDLVFIGAIPTQARRSEIPRSCVPDIDVMDPQALDPVDMDGKCVNPHEAVKEVLTTKTARARANPTPSTRGTVPRSPHQLGSGNGTHDRAKVSVTVCSSVDSVKKVPAKGTSGKDMDVGYDPLV